MRPALNDAIHPYNFLHVVRVPKGTLHTGSTAFPPGFTTQNRGPMSRTGSIRQFVAAALAAALTLSAVPAAQAGPQRVSEPGASVTSTTTEPTAIVSGTLRRAIADPVPHTASAMPDVPTPTATLEPRTWAIIDSPTGQNIPVDPDSPALADVPSGAEVTATVELDVQAQRRLKADGLNVDKLSTTSQRAIEAALADVDPLPVHSASVTKYAATKKNVKHKAYVLAIQDAQNPDNFTLPQAKALTDRTANYWKTESQGNITSFTVADQKTWKVNDSCRKFDNDPFSFWDQAEQRFPGLNTYADGQHLMVYLPEGCQLSLGYTGVALIGSDINSGGPSMVLDDDLLTAAHELGHNFSLGHANLQIGSGNDAMVLPYFALYGPMSAATGDEPGALDIGFQHQLKVHPSGALRAVTRLGTTSAKLAPVSATSGLRGLTFYDPVTKGRYYVEYRSGTGKDADTFYASGDQIFSDVTYGPGVRVYRIEQDGFGAKELVNVTSSHGGVFYPALSQNRMYTAPGKVFTVTVGAVTPDSADVKVSFKPVTTTTKLSVSKATFGKRATVKVTTTGTPTPVGKVRIYDGKKKLKTLNLSKGSASYKLPADLKVGKHRITAKYLPASGYVASSAAKTISVGKAKAKAKITMQTIKVKTLKAGTRAKVTVKLGTIAKRAPTGKVAVQVGKRTVSKTVKLKRVKGVWQATITTKKLPKGKVGVAYSGNGTYAKTIYATKYWVK